jgi:hypothetical protein
MLVLARNKLLTGHNLGMLIADIVELSYLAATKNDMLKKV